MNKLVNDTTKRANWTPEQKRFEYDQDNERRRRKLRQSWWRSLNKKFPDGTVFGWHEISGINDGMSDRAGWLIENKIIEFVEFDTFNTERRFRVVQDSPYKSGYCINCALLQPMKCCKWRPHMGGIWIPELMSCIRFTQREVKGE
jgi:hypothetical protein